MALTRILEFTNLNVINMQYFLVNKSSLAKTWRKSLALALKANYALFQYLRILYPILFEVLTSWSSSCIDILHFLTFFTYPISSFYTVCLSYPPWSTTTWRSFYIQTFSDFNFFLTYPISLFYNVSYPILLEALLAYRYFTIFTFFTPPFYVYLSYPPWSIYSLKLFLIQIC